MKNIITISFFMFIFSTVVFASDWNQFLGDAHLTSKSKEVFEPPLSVKWTFLAKDKIISSATIKDGRIFFGARDKIFYALDEEDGSLLWQYSTNGWVDSSAFVEDDYVFFSSKDGYIYKLNVADGSLVWRYKTGGTNLSSPIVSDGILIAGVGFPKKEIVALDSNTSELLWSYNTDQMVYSTAAINGDYFYIGANDGIIYAFNKSNGDLLWKFKTKGSVYYASPAYKDGVLYIAPGKFDWNLYAINAKTGDLVWNFLPNDAQQTPTYVSNVAINNDEIYFVSGYGKQFLYCLNSSTGNLKWKRGLAPATRYGFSSTPIATEYTVYVATSSGKLKAFEVGSGNLLWEYDLGAAALSSISISNGTLYIGTFEGKLFAFR